MEAFESSVGNEMVCPVHAVDAGEQLSVAKDRMVAHDISVLPALGRGGRVVGVVGRTDLLKASRIQVEEGERRLKLPEIPIEEIMRPAVGLVGPESTLKDAAIRMVEHRFHRLFVVVEGRLSGVVSTRELMRAVVRARIGIPVVELMSTPVMTVELQDPIGPVVQGLAEAPMSCFVVADGGWPIGLFSKTRALAAQGAPSDGTVEEWMDPRVVCLPSKMPIHRAARVALATRARGVVAVNDGGIQGIVSGLDFARLVAAGGSGASTR